MNSRITYNNLKTFQCENEAFLYLLTSLKSKTRKIIIQHWNFSCPIFQAKRGVKEQDSSPRRIQPVTDQLDAGALEFYRPYCKQLEICWTFSITLGVDFHLLQLLLLPFCSPEGVQSQYSPTRTKDLSSFPRLMQLCQKRAIFLQCIGCIGTKRMSPCINFAVHVGERFLLRSGTGFFT